MPDPNLSLIRSNSGVGFRVDPQYADRFGGLLRGLEEAGYPIRHGGSFNVRNIAGTNTPSEHSFGRAIDVNEEQNRQGLNLPSDMPPELAHALATKYGLTWGGDWQGKTRDPMHFEVARPGVGQPVQQAVAPSMQTNDQLMMARYAQGQGGDRGALPALIAQGGMPPTQGPQMAPPLMGPPADPFAGFLQRLGQTGQQPPGQQWT